VAVSLHLEGVIREGVYTMVGGPNYETVAELNLLRELGVDSVGIGFTFQNFQPELFPFTFRLLHCFPMDIIKDHAEF
jgi:hypothetical protein